MPEFGEQIKARAPIHSKFLIPFDVLRASRSTQVAAFFCSCIEKVYICRLFTYVVLRSIAVYTYQNRQHIPHVELTRRLIHELKAGYFDILATTTNAILRSQRKFRFQLNIPNFTITAMDTSMGSPAKLSPPKGKKLKSRSNDETFPKLRRLGIADAMIRREGSRLRRLEGTVPVRDVERRKSG